MLLIRIGGLALFGEVFRRPPDFQIGMDGREDYVGTTDLHLRLKQEGFGKKASIRTVI